MNKKLGSRPFAVRTIAALVLLYGISMLVLTFSYANHYAEQMMQMTRIQGEEIASELRTCMDANTESVECRNGFNLAQAAAIMRHYRYMGVPELKKMGIDFDCTLYQMVKKQGKVVSAKELRPQTPVLLTGPFSKQSGIIVFADTFDESQMEKLENVIESGKFTTYIENARGYKEGRFFYPAVINIGEEGKKDTEIRTGYYDRCV